MRRHGYTESFCEITEQYLRIMSTGVVEFDCLMVELHCRMKVLTQVGLDPEAVGEPEGGERVFANFKQVMFMAQLLIRRTLWKL